jgi:Fe2+ transport system protein FeoA
MEVLNLINAVSDRKFVIKSIDLERESKLRLHTMGIHARGIYEKKGGNGNGPVLISNISSNSTPVAIGKEIASCINIEYIDDKP